MDAMSLFSGAGGLDVGFINAGINVIVANEIMPDACDTYAANHPNSRLIRGDLAEHLGDIAQYRGHVDIVFGGPPCQGFSVAGKMNPEDARSQMIWRFVDVIELIQPSSFVMENVKALACLEKWKSVRTKYLNRMNDLGYDVKHVVLNAADYGVPQKRERVFFIGIKKSIHAPISNIEYTILQKRKKSETLRSLLTKLPVAGTAGNPLTCTAKITLAERPIMRKSPYAGMYFNGMGRPMNLDGYANTLPASMGGNKTPIIDERFLRNPGAPDWIGDYHRGLMNGTIEPKFTEDVPPYLRRLTIREAAMIQTFPEHYVFKGSKSKIYTQIGNAVPCKLAEVVAQSLKMMLDGDGHTSDCSLCVASNSKWNDAGEVQ